MSHWWSTGRASANQPATEVLMVLVVPATALTDFTGIGDEPEGSTGVTSLSSHLPSRRVRPPPMEARDLGISDTGPERTRGSDEEFRRIRASRNPDQVP
ncbi:hypothetical protein BA059_10180 [Mycolicibacterium sp. (ex Dasyatis americana)]|nr:hypothetical protein BA059_10180 [Mycolicibacterium sp. (ex Dasyatis americana)]